MTSRHIDSAFITRRRRWLFGGAALVAAAGGGGLAWWQSSSRSTQPASSSPADEVGLSAREEASLSKLWALNLATPSGSTLSLASLRGKPILLNFWATWCPPCVEELPLIDRFYQENVNNGWQVLGLAVDQVAAVTNFLGKMPVKFPVAMAGMAGIELSKVLGNLSGGLPFTVVIGSQATVLHRKMGRVSVDDLKAWSTLT